MSNSKKITPLRNNQIQSQKLFPNEEVDMMLAFHIFHILIWAKIYVKALILSWYFFFFQKIMNFLWSSIPGLFFATTTPIHHYNDGTAFRGLSFIQGSPVKLPTSGWEPKYFLLSSISLVSFKNGLVAEKVEFHFFFLNACEYFKLCGSVSLHITSSPRQWFYHLLGKKCHLKLLITFFFGHRFEVSA